jgi:hypothetical protein
MVSFFQLINLPFSFSIFFFFDFLLTYLPLRKNFFSAFALKPFYIGLYKLTGNCWKVGVAFARLLSVRVNSAFDILADDNNVLKIKSLEIRMGKNKYEQTVFLD